MMCKSSLHAIGISVLLCVASPPLPAFDPPVVPDPPAAMDVLSKGGAKSDVRYYGQAAKEGKIDLTATNGFFDRCFQAADEHEAIPGDGPFIRSSFGYLARNREDAPGTARWRLWCADAGEIKAQFFMQVPANETNRPWVIKVGDEAHSLRVGESDGRSAQKQTLVFTVKEPGKVTFAIDCMKNPPPEKTRIFRIRLDGSAIDKASLLRARWRPSAVHVSYFPPEECPAPNIWVFETRAVSKTSSYSPITTPFGYFGTSFDNQGRVREGAGFNFSMWIASKQATTAPPIEQVSRLIGTEIPDAEYSSFGHEGTGVKFRNAIAYKNGADRIIQALRADVKDGLWTFHGYFYDEQERRWRLYASAQKPVKKEAESGTFRKTGSFCEIVGPATVERTGDVVREIKRRGWFYGSDRRWYRAQLADTTNDRKARKLSASLEKGEPGKLDSARSYYMDDYASEGWMAMATGGMEQFVPQMQDEGALRKPVDPAPLPEYLTPEKTAQLFEIPVLFGASKVLQVSSNDAIIDYEIRKTGPNSKAILYYGTQDCLTFIRREIPGGSAVEKQLWGAGRTWQSATPKQDVTAGMNRFKLSGLTADTTYYYRLFVTHDQGKSWDYQSKRFHTP